MSFKFMEMNIDENTPIMDMDKKDIVLQLQLSEYYRDELRESLHKLKELFNINFQDYPIDWDLNNDEHMADYIYGSIKRIHTNNLV